MRLIHFAHRAEAQELLRRKNFKSLGLDHIHLYQNPEENELLLISGEGVFDALKNLSFVSAQYEITQVLNLGIAGSLNKELMIGEIYPVRTVYAYDAKPLFQSFEIEKSGIDLITSFERVLNDDYAATLSHFAGLVDRELWGLCFALKGQGIKVSSYKLISDFAGAETQCFDIKEMGLEYSIRLADFYESSLQVFTPQNKRDILELDGFSKLYLTHQNRIQLESLLQKLVLKTGLSFNEIFKNIDAQKIIDEANRPKLASKMIIEKLSEILSPVRTKTFKKLESTCLDLSQAGAKVHFDPNLEKKSFTLNMEINSQTNIDKLIEALEKTKYSQIEKILLGDFDV